jgi:TetR/AcrR family transcriptional repressor of nem operon
MSDEPATEILEATYYILSEHGYADLTIQDIADEADTNNSTIYYHYDSKDQLFVALLDKLFEQFADRVNSPEGDTPREQLDTLLQILLTADADSDRNKFRTAMLELKAQAPYKPVLRERLTEFDKFLCEQLREILATGMATGEFSETIHPASVAEYLTATITGVHTRHAAINQSSDRLYTTMTRYIEEHLLADKQTEIE